MQMATILNESERWRLGMVFGMVRTAVDMGQRSGSRIEVVWLLRLAISTEDTTS
jgi:hypothetical protein